MVWTASDMPNQQDRRIIVTGANSGLGLVTAREFARAGAHVVMASRDLARGETAARTVRASVPGSNVDVRQLDLADLRSVRAFARAYSDSYGELDVLVNNAGVMAIPRRMTVDGFEMQFGTNHLGHFALTGLLLDRMQDRPDPRVVTVTSGFHRIGRMDFGDLQSERRYGKWRAYARSKLANLLFTYELDRRAAAAASPLRSVAAHPGYAATNLQLAGPRASESRWQEWVAATGNRVLAQSDEMGALPTLYAATAPDIPGGAFAGPGSFAGQRGYPKLVGSSRASTDPAAARMLWDLSEDLTGVHFDFAGPLTRRS